MNTLSTLYGYAPAIYQFVSGATQFPVTATGLTNFTDGIPSNYDITNSSPKRVLIGDMNGICNLATRDQYFLQCGGFYTFDTIVSGYINGYPKGIQLGYWNGTYYRRVLSLIDNNIYNFVNDSSYIDNIHWAYCDDSSQHQMAIFFDYNNSQYVKWWEGDTSNVTYTYTAPYDCCFIYSLYFLTQTYPSTYKMNLYISYGGTKKLVSGSSATTGVSKLQLCHYVTIKKGTVVTAELLGPCQETLGTYVVAKLTTGDWS